MAAKAERCSLVAPATSPCDFSSSPTLFDTIQAARQYTLAGVVERIRCPMLITDPDEESFWPGQSQQVYDALSGPKLLVRYGYAQPLDDATDKEQLGKGHSGITLFENNSGTVFFSPMVQ